ncbi:MAG: penicillin acylase family protein [Anaerolineales bacterium]|nr:penicillin acylase family protein [Anaerolineales bacterium]MCX7755625.1 penicillin acylase family protein [Anaerolineales bacterium]MDW8276592.1 penicillin acylase family protein [Anaerolineales bacterium]
MMSSLSRLFHSLASPRRALTFTALAGVLFWLLARGLGDLPPGAPTIFDLQLAFSTEKFQSVIAAWGDGNVAAYVNGMWLDYLYPIAYALALSAWLAVLTRRAAAPPSPFTLALFAAPLLAALLDYLENSLHLLMLVGLKTTPAALVFLASLAAALKWMLAGLTIFVILLLALTRPFHTTSPKEAPMHTFKKILLILLLVLLIAAPTYAYFGVIRPALPQLDGELALEGLTAPVTIYRDSSGIPHIFAENAHDLFFAQGFVHAQDRLWAMESARRAAHGTLSEVIGERGLKNDTMMRILGMTESAEADWKTLDAENQAALTAYTDGVNAFLARAGENLPLELKILGITPQPWTPIDSLVFGKLVAWGLSNNYQDELVISKLTQTLSWDETLSLLPEYPGPDVIPDANAALLPETIDSMLAFARQVNAAALMRPDQGSNAWVVGGSHTASGKPLLAGDPHQALSMPTLWYEVGLHTTDNQYNVVGASLPGLPGVEIGHNAHIAWAVTNARPDVQDLFIETLNEDGTQYLFKDEWKPLTIREEVIQVKGGEAVTLKVRLTHHGPLVSDATPDSHQHLALRWTGIDQGRPLAQAILQLNRAQNWDEFRAALSLWQLPGMNFVYADVNGNIGYQMSGAVPVRAKNDLYGLAPVSGSDGEHEWMGFVPFHELPSAQNPKGDFFASANNRPAGLDYPHFLSHYYQPPYRVALISQTIRTLKNATTEDFAKLQASQYSDINRQLAQAIAAEAAPQTDAEKAALSLLKDWDGVMSPESRAAALSELALRKLIRLALEPKLDSASIDSYLTLAGYPYMFLQNLLDDPANPWWHGRRAELLTAALASAVTELGDQTWGDIHQYTASHPLGSIGPLRPIFNRGPFPIGGNWNTVNSGGYYPDQPYAMALGPAYRIIANPADWDASLSIVPTGQSGQPFSPHYADQIQPWLKVEYHPLPFSLEAIEAAAVHVLHIAVRH